MVVGRRPGFPKARTRGGPAFAAARAGRRHDRRASTPRRCYWRGPALLEGRTATAHWEVLEAFRDQFPRVNVVARLYEIDRMCFTCAGRVGSRWI